MYIAIAGNIGSGKTTLTEILSERLGYDPYYEDDNNPYLGDFYDDMNRWSFNLQIYFLGKRIRSMNSILSSGTNVIQDRTIYEDAHIFATNLNQMGLMSGRDFRTYMEVFALTAEQIRKPNLLIYLKASVPTLVSQIQKRGRAYEMSISQEYLARLNEYYDRWISTIYDGRTIVIDIDKEDFILNPKLIDQIVEKIEGK